MAVGSVAQTKCDMPAIKGIFESVGQQITNHLVELGMVYPCHQALVGMLELVSNMALVGIVFIHIKHALGKSHHIGMLALQLHLLLVDLTHIQNLVHQVQNTLGVAFYQSQLFGILSSRMALFQFLEWCHDKCEWRTDVVSGINQEFHLLIVHLPALFTDIDIYQEKQDG